MEDLLLAVSQHQLVEGVGFPFDLCDAVDVELAPLFPGQRVSIGKWGA